MNDLPNNQMSGEEFEAYQSNRSHKKTLSFPIVPMLGVLVVIALMTGSFLAGIQYQKQQQKSITPALVGQNNGFGGQGQPKRGFGDMGTVTAITDTAITVKNAQSGATKTYTIGTSTTITEDGNELTATQIQVNDSVLIQTDTADTAVATQIIVNPTFGAPSGANNGAQSL